MQDHQYSKRSGRVKLANLLCATFLDVSARLSDAAEEEKNLAVAHGLCLLYQRTADGSLQLTGVEYIVPTSAWTHANAPTLMGQTLKRDQQLGIWYLHAWIWEFNPSGAFADWNPRARC